MTPAQIEDIVKHAVKEAVPETLKTLGFNVEDPAALRADMDWTRRSRVMMEGIAKQGVTTFVTAFFGLLVTAIGYGFIVMIKKSGG